MLSSLSILDASPLSDIWFAIIGIANYGIVSYSMCHLYTFLMVSFEAQIFLIFMKSNLSTFFFITMLLVSYLRRLCLTQVNEHLLSCASKTFIVLLLILDHPFWVNTGVWFVQFPSFACRYPLVLEPFVYMNTFNPHIHLMIVALSSLLYRG